MQAGMNNDMLYYLLGFAAQGSGNISLSGPFMNDIAAAV
jgi:hypothetical protein